MNLLIKMGKQIAKHKFLILLIGFLLLIPSLIGMVTTRVNYDLLSYLPDTLETVKGQDIMVDEYGMGAFSMVVVENMELKDVQKLEKKFEAVDHVKDVLWYDDVADLNLPVQMIPKKLREGFFKGNATMMIVLFDNTTSSDESMNAVAEMRKLANKQCFISGMSGVVNDIKDVALDELPVYVVIAAVLSFLVLEFTTESFLVPVFFLLSIGIAIIYNLGSNVFLGQVSYITKALTAVLQLGVTMDYSIFLLNSYEEYKENFKTIAKAVGKENEATEKVEEIKEFLSEVSKLSQEVVEGKTVLTVSPKNDAYTAHTSSSFVGQVLEKAGFVNAVQSEEFEQSLSLEQLVEINPDIIIYMRDDKDKTIYSQWKDTELYNSLDAVKNDQVFTTVARGPWTQYRGFISVKTIVNEVEGWLLNK